MRQRYRLAGSIALFAIGLAMFIGGAFWYDSRLGISALGVALALGALFVDDGME